MDKVSSNPPDTMNDRYQRQKYIDTSIGSVDQTTHPICQLKYDGIWCCAEVDQSNTVRYFSRNGELKKTEHLPHIPIEPGCYIGELMFGSEWSKEKDRSGLFYMFDLTELRSVCLKNEPYLTRYTRLAELHHSDMLPTRWRLVQNYPTHQSLDIWKLLVESGEYEGLVFRHQANNWHTPLLRAKLEITEDLYIMGYIEGEGRLKGTLGAVRASLSPFGAGPEFVIGGGFTDALRKHIWAHRTQMLGRCFTVTAKKKFKSGLLRHPNFKCWHDEK